MFSNVLAYLFSFKQLANFALLIHRLCKDIQACRCKLSHLPRFVDEKLVCCLFRDDAGANFEVLQEVKHVLLANFHNFLLCLGITAFKFMLEVDLIDVKKNFPDIS